MAIPAVRSPRTIGRVDPFREFDDLYGQLGRWVDALAGQGETGWRGWSPLADVAESDDAYVVELELPGLKREDVTVELTGAVLRVYGERKEKERQGALRHRSRRTGRFHYGVRLPQGVDADKVDATLEDGVLTVRVPKSDTAKPRRVAVSGT